MQNDAKRFTLASPGPLPDVLEAVLTCQSSILSLEKLGPGLWSESGALAL